MLYSICIPTYNRPACVQRHLESLRALLSDSRLHGKIEVCISDNNENNDTKKVVEEFAAKNLFPIRYFKQQKNVGFSRNVLSALKLATGDYVHLISDEGVHKRQMLLEITQCLQNESPDVLFLYHKGTVPIRDPQKLVDAMLSPKGIYAGFGGGMGTFIMRRGFFEKFMREHEALRTAIYPLGFMHIPIFLLAIKNSKKISIVDIRNMKHEGSKQVIEREAEPKIDYPRSIARVFVHHYYFLIKECANAGILTKEEFARFKENFLSALFFLLLRIRIFTPPQIYAEETKEVLANMAEVEKDYTSRRDKLTFEFYKRVVLNRMLPYHWIYMLWLFYKKKIRNDPEVVDFFEYYKKHKFSKQSLLAVIPDDETGKNS